MIRRLTEEDEAALQEFLEQDVAANLFLMGVLMHRPMSQPWWIGAFKGDGLVGCLLLMPGHLVVPFCPDPNEARRLGLALRQAPPVRMAVGPREACDRLLEGWNPRVRIRCKHDQQLYEATEVTVPCPAIAVQAAANQWQEIARNATAMEREDTGFDPGVHDPHAHRLAVQERLDQGRTWVLMQEGVVSFQINVGMHTPWGAQLGGTYVPPAFRGNRLATRGTADVTQRLLQSLPRVTLHVNESNLPAVRTYESVGFRPIHPFRLISMEPKE